MDWVTGLQKAINYIEAHLTEEIDYEAVAAQSFLQIIIFREFSVFFAELLSENISATAGSLSPAKSLHKEMKKL